MLHLILQQEDHPSGPLTVEGGLMLWTIVVFVLLLAILKRFAWPAILGAVEAREKALEEQLSEAERNRVEAAALLAEHKKLVAEAKSQAHTVVAEARTLAEKERALALEKTKQEQAELLARARREIVAERDRAVADLRREAVDLSLAAASKLIGERLSSETDRKLVIRLPRHAGRRPLRSVTIARNYAEALFDLGERSGQMERYAELIDAVAGAIESTPRVQAVLMSPRVPKRTKSELLGAALKDVPREFVLFLQAVVKRGRQQLLGEIATEYLGLLDITLNRVRAGMTLARPADAALKRSIQEALSSKLGQGGARLVLGRSGDSRRSDRPGGRADP